MKTPVITRQGLGLVVGMVAAIALTAAALISFSAGDGFEIRPDSGEVREAG